MTLRTITSRDNVKLHIKELGLAPAVFQNWGMGEDTEYPYAEQGRRLRWLRQAQRFDTATAFAAWLGWNQSGASMFETGRRQVPGDKARQLSAKIAGFDPMWLWTGEKRGLSFDLLRRIEAEEAKDKAREAESAPQSTSDER